MNTKVCRMCKGDKPLAAYNIDRRSTKGKPFYRTACRECEREKSRLTEALKKTAPPQPKDRVCQCCEKIIAEEDRINFDHCPTTMKFRGWICTNCNTGLGKFGDNLEGLNKVIEYLKGYDNESR